MTARRLQFKLNAQKKVKRFWMILLVLFPVVLLWVNQTVNSTKILYQIQKVKKEYQLEEDRKISLEMLRDRLTSLEFVEWTAKNKLHMTDTNKNNVVLMSVKS